MFRLQKNHESFLFIILVLFIIYIYISMKNTDANSDVLKLTKLKFDKCMKEAAKKYYDNTDKFFGELSGCIKNYIAISDTHMDFIANYAGDEKKVFLTMAADYLKKECKWLTIGIGGSTAAEETILAKYPNCLIYGVDPGNVGNFSNIGKLLKMGVGIEDSNITISIDTKIRYEVRTVAVMSFTKMLDEFVHSRFVHYATFDIEGLEMVILKEIVGKGKLSKENITFCQLDVEMHNPTQDTINPLASKINRVEWMLNFSNELSPYLPIFTIPYGPGHKVTFVNIVHPECQAAFNIKSSLRTAAN